MKYLKGKAKNIAKVEDSIIVGSLISTYPEKSSKKI